MDLVGIVNNIAVGVIDLLPGKAVLLADLRQVVAGDDGIGVARRRPPVPKTSTFRTRSPEA